MASFDADVAVAQAAVDTVLDGSEAAILDAIAKASGNDTAKLNAAIRVCEKIVPFVSRPFKTATVSNDADYPLYAKHPNDAVNLAVLRAVFSSGDPKHEQVRLVVRQALAWKFNRAIDPGVVLSSK